MSKIAYLSKSTIPSRSANSVHVMKMCQALANENHDVTLYSYSGVGEDDIHEFYGVKNNFHVIRTGRILSQRIQPIIHLMKVKKEINKINLPDYMYSRDLLSVYFLRNSGVPFAYEAHSYPKDRLKLQLEKRIFTNKNFKFLGVISKALKRTYIENYPELLNNKIIVIPDGADLPQQIDDINKTIKVENKDSELRKPQIGYIGHLYEGRGIDIVIEVSKKLKECDFHIIGGEEKDIKYWCEKVGNQENINFHGFVPNYQLSDYYKKLDILLAPYQEKVLIGNGKTDTSKWMSPMKIFEYMSHKKCIISSNLEVLKEVLVDRHNSILVNPTSIDDWIDAIREVVEDTDLFNRLSNNAYNDLALKYTWSKRAKIILEELINN